MCFKSLKLKMKKLSFLNFFTKRKFTKSKISNNFFDDFKNNSPENSESFHHSPSHKNILLDSFAKTNIGAVIYLKQKARRWKNIAFLVIFFSTILFFKILQLRVFTELFAPKS